VAGVPALIKYLVIFPGGLHASILFIIKKRGFNMCKHKKRGFYCLLVKGSAVVVKVFKNLDLCLAWCDASGYVLVKYDYIKGC
jgi:hypothetical protein